jgi:hypothetical protein
MTRLYSFAAWLRRLLTKNKDWIPACAGMTRL